jgi:hypothetical protein
MSEEAEPKVVDLKVLQINPETREAIVEGPGGFIFKLPEPVPDGVQVGETVGVVEELWDEWKTFWDEQYSGTD